MHTSTPVCDIWKLTTHDCHTRSSSDFLTNLLVLLIRILNAGLSDGGLLIHLSEATAGTLSGIGHSSVYEELATFS